MLAPCAVRNGIFRTDVSLRGFARLFFMDNLEIRRNKIRRWQLFLRAARNATLLDRPRVRPLWRPHKIYHPPMFDVLQSSYADVAHELNVMRNAFVNESVLFVAGDGLALMRMNHLLASHADVYFDQTPFVIPVQGMCACRARARARYAYGMRMVGARTIVQSYAPTGEHPHGLFHLMHCEWRLHRQFIMWCASVVDNKQVIEDPNVSVFNVHRFFFLNVVTRACAEYINFVGALPGAEDVSDPEAFLLKAEANRDFAWVCHFAYDAGFFVLDFLQNVRANESKKLDILWREFFASAHSGTANKTQYVPMSIMRVFWGMALTPEIDALYHKLRAVPTSDADGSCVGWDMLIEMLNAAIKAHVSHFVSETQVRNFVQNWALLEQVQQHMRAMAYGPGAAGDGLSHQIDASADVAKLVKKFKEVIGTTWAQVTRRDTVSHVTTGPQRSAVPWRETAAVMRRAGRDAPEAYIRRKVSELTPFFEWCA